MTENCTARPAILVDLRKYRIRIHKTTLHSIGDPENILLLVNPEEQTLAILRCDRSDPKAHHIAKASHVSQKPLELYSQSLVLSLRSICGDWQDNQTYRLYGEIIPSEGIARFHMAESILVSGA